MSRPAWIVLALAVVAAVAAIVVFTTNAPAPGLVDGAQFARLQEQGVRIIDVRTAGEYALGHIDGAENVPLGQFADALEGWDPADPIALYCATGSRSAEAAHMLKNAGFEKVYDLSGGIAAWEGEIQGGTASAGTQIQNRHGVPVMYEFLTDW